MATITKPRIESIDLLKGVVMVIMALDHVRDYFHYSSYFFDPTDPTQTTLPLFFTRFITNFCAPTFSFLAGLSAFMVGKRKNLNELSAFLFKRGIWLIFVELVIINFGWHFDIHYTDILLQVIWALGLSMIVLSALIHLPRKLLFILSCIIIFSHNLLDPIHFEGSFLWTLVHERNRFPFHGHIIGSGYAIIPWGAVMSLGYCFGPFYENNYDPAKRKKLFNTIGFAAIVLMIILRWINVYGNLLPWKNYGNFNQTLISFLSFTKYPPSLCFLLTTLGAAIIFLANSENLKGKLVNFFTVFGRVPFFYYIIHIYLVHFFALVAAQLTGIGWQKMILPSMPFRTPSLQGFGFNLGIVYLVWMGLIILLYPVCKIFDKYKQSHKEQWWLSYL